MPQRRLRKACAAGAPTSPRPRTWSLTHGASSADLHQDGPSSSGKILLIMAWLVAVSDGARPPRGGRAASPWGERSRPRLRTRVRLALAAESGPHLFLTFDDVRVRCNKGASSQGRPSARSDCPPDHLGRVGGFHYQSPTSALEAIDGRDRVGYVQPKEPPFQRYDRAASGQPRSISMGSVRFG